MTRRRMVLGTAVVAVVAGGAWFVWGPSAPAAPGIRTAAVSRGSIVKTVTASGTTQAVTLVSVGSQVSGTITWLGADYNSVVEQGQIIARLDPSLLEAQVDQAAASLTRVNADLQQRTMTLADKEAKLVRTRALRDQGLVSASDLGDAELAAAMARTDLASVEAQVSQAEAALSQARLNLNYAIIAAPTRGTVIDRSVDVGQTVAASLSSPTLFVIAADLSAMRVDLSVDESDIGVVRPGQPVTMTVDAYPGERFEGVVSQVRPQPVVASNVTTYTTIVDVANPDLELKLGMTASAEIEVARRDDVVRVPNAALRFSPTADMFAALGQDPVGPGRQPGEDVVRAVATSRTPTATGRVWVLENGALRAIPVRTGLSDGSVTELVDPGAAADLDAGVLLVTGLSIATPSTAASSPSSLTTVLGGGGRGGGFR